MASIDEMHATSVSGDLAMVKQKIIAQLLRMKREEVPEAVSKKLPGVVMPREAVEKKREQLRKMDEQTRD
jgi:hypothetical protein